MPVNKVIVQRLDSTALGFGTMVFKIREQVSDHNIIMELLRGIRHDYPGIWLQFMHEIARPRPPAPGTTTTVDEKVLAVKAEPETPDPVG